MSTFGKYRGQVVDNADPMMLARLQVMVPSVADAPLNWAMPCSPFAGPGVGFVTVPPIGANVWVEFEGGDLNHPIWSGCFWGDGELPAEAQVSPPDKVQVLKADGFLFVANSAGPNHFAIELSPPLVDTPLSIVLDDEGILLSNNGAVTVKLAADTLTLHNDQTGDVELAEDGVHVSCGTPEIAVTPDEIEITNGSSTIVVSSSEVDVNDGALEVR